MLLPQNGIAAHNEVQLKYNWYVIETLYLGLFQQSQYISKW